jgi:hypothetical protein
MMLYRVRAGQRKNTRKIVKLYSHIFNNRSPCFVEQAVSFDAVNQLELSPYISIKFTRSIFHEEVERDENNVLVLDYLDCIVFPGSTYEIYSNNIQELTGDKVKLLVKLDSGE